MHAIVMDVDRRLEQKLVSNICAMCTVSEQSLIVADTGDVGLEST